MIQIPLSSQKYPGLVALVDDEDAGLVAGYAWRAINGRTSKTFYAAAHMPGSGKRGKTARMHRLIAGAAPGQKVDRANRNGLDNRRENLRFGTDSEHQANQGLTCKNSSGYKGVSWDKSRRKWAAFISVNGKHKNLGRFDDPIEAARSYDTAALEAYGEFAVLNFPGPAAALWISS